VGPALVSVVAGGKEGDKGWRKERDTGARNVGREQDKNGGLKENTFHRTLSKRGERLLTTLLGFLTCEEKDKKEGRSSVARREGEPDWGPASGGNGGRDTN